MMKTRRFFAIALAVLLLVATVSVVGVLTVGAAETEIDTAEEFAALNGQEGNFKLTANITLTGTVASFKGTLDGNGHTLTVSAPVFGTLSGEVKDLTIEGAITSDATSTIGALANTVSGNLTVTGVTNKASVTAANATNVGGLVGTVSDKATVNFTRVTNDGDVQGKIAVGGIIAYIGYNTNTTVHESINNGDITMTDADAGVGGIIGSGGWGDSKNEIVTITYCVNTGAVSSIKGATAVKERGRAAGIIGRLNKGAQKLTVDHCYNVGAITLNGSKNGDDGAAGIAAYVQQAYITNCYNIGVLTSTSNRYEIGRSRSNNAEFCSNNYYVERGIGNHSTTQAAACADKDALIEALAELGYVVDPAVNNGYPILKWQCEHRNGANCLGTCFFCGAKLGEGAGDHAWNEWTEKSPVSATHDQIEERTCKNCSETEERVGAKALGTITPVDGVYTVENEAQLVWLFYHLNNKTVSGDADIVLAADITLTNGLDMVKNKYSGEFDGKGHTISGLNNTLFFEITGTVQNVTLEGDIVYEVKDGVNNDSIRCAASVAMNARKGYVVRNVVSNVNISLTAKNINAGGILGFANAGVIENVTYGGTYTVKWLGEACAIGGIVGWLNDDGATSKLTNCYFTGSLTASSDETFEKETFFGGIIGRSRNGSDNCSEIIDGCVATGSLSVDVKSNDVRVGGLVASFDRTAKHEVKNSTFNGTITAPTATKLSNLIGNGTVTVSDCFDLTAETKDGDVFTMAGVKYQKYNFGYVNADTSALVSTGMTTDAAIGAYLSLKDNGDKHNVRFVLLANMEKLSGISAADITITFKKGDAEVKKIDKTFGGEENDFTAYEAVLAAGEPYFAAEGYALFGLVVVDIPDGEWDTVTLTATDAVSGDVILETVTATYPLA